MFLMFGPGLNEMPFRSNNTLKKVVAAGITALLALHCAVPANACGPSFIRPVFLFENSPDLPFAEFTKGKIGILKPTFGRKTLTIAFRYLNGGSFTTDEQKVLVTALSGKAVEEPATDPVKVWVETRKQFLAENEKLPEIYVEQRYGGYDFFPNCTPNAFEVASETLKARVASYGAGDKNVQAWLKAQDTVFQNCSSAGNFPEALGNETVEWLRKDRDYQIAAAHFYSLKFDQARKLFTAIALDAASPWQETADYLVGRTWIRQASLTQNETESDEAYRQAELYLQALQIRSTKFARATARLLALVKYRIHPEQRMRELAQLLAYQNGNDNIGQDLIDYVWLVDKFETEKLEEIAKSKNPPKGTEVESERDRFFRERREAIRAGQMLEITIYPKLKEGTPDYSEHVMLDFKQDITEAEVIREFEVKTGRNLTEEELKQIKERLNGAIEYRKYLLSPNRKIGSVNEHKGCDYECERLTIAGRPESLRTDDLTDWMLTLQTDDPAAYLHALSKWRETKSEAWLAVVMTKAQKGSPRLAQVMRRAERIERDSPAFATIAYNLVRLKISLGQQIQARAILDDIVSWQSEVLPISAQNQFLEQRMRLSKTLDEFLQYSSRQPIAFYDDYRYGKIRDFIEDAKNSFDPDYNKQSKEEFDREIEKSYATLLPWDNQASFDEATIELINWHFPLSVMADVSMNPALTEHQRRRFALATWTRAIVLNQPSVAQKIAPEVLKLAPELATVFQAYQDSRTPQERNNAALFVLLKFPSLSPLLDVSVYGLKAAEDGDYYFELAWWCAPSQTEYNREGNEVRKVVSKPMFLTPAQIEASRRERAALIAIGSAKSYLGKQAIAWAKSSPADPRIPEALYIAVQANSPYKYGCSSWEHDEAIRKRAETILRTRYPESTWTGKLLDQEN
jgi:hypothetical protein